MSAINNNDNTNIHENVARLDKELKEERRRNQLLRIIPTNSIKFVNKETGAFDAQAYDAEIEKRVKSNMDVEEVAEMWANIFEVENYNIMIQQQQQNQKIASNTHRLKTASSHNYSPPGNIGSNNNSRNTNRMWYLDLFNDNIATTSSVSAARRS